MKHTQTRWLATSDGLMNVTYLKYRGQNQNYSKILNYMAICRLLNIIWPRSLVQIEIQTLINYERHYAGDIQQLFIC